MSQKFIVSISVDDQDSELDDLFLDCLFKFPPNVGDHIPLLSNKTPVWLMAIDTRKWLDIRKCETGLVITKRFINEYGDIDLIAKEWD